MKQADRSHYKIDALASLRWSLLDEHRYDRKNDWYFRNASRWVRMSEPAKEDRSGLLIKHGDKFMQAFSRLKYDIAYQHDDIRIIDVPKDVKRGWSHEVGRPVDKVLCLTVKPPIESATLFLTALYHQTENDALILRLVANLDRKAMGVF